MSYLYVVRCNFTRPDLEEEWNDWYNGAKVDQLLVMPFFSSNQRFRAVAMDDQRRYLAVWGIEDQSAFTTPEYLAGWGFANWAEFITDWSRDLYALPEGVVGADFAVTTSGRLHLVAFDAQSEDEASAGARALAERDPKMTWMHAVGLDQYAPWMGLRAHLDAKVERLDEARASGACEALFEPISPARRVD
jgi:hypothetical protein